MTHQRRFGHQDGSCSIETDVLNDNTPLLSPRSFLSLQLPNHCKMTHKHEAERLGSVGLSRNGIFKSEKTEPSYFTRASKNIQIIANYVDKMNKGIYKDNGEPDKPSTKKVHHEPAGKLRTASESSSDTSCPSKSSGQWS